MKTLVLLFLMISVAASGQITTKGEEVSEPILLSDGKNLPIEITYIPEGEQNRYVMLYRNREYANIQDWRTVGFSATAEDLNSLYRDLDAIFDGPEGKEKEYTLNDTTARAFYEGKVLYMYFYQPGEPMAYVAIGRKSLAKSFGITAN